MPIELSSCKLKILGLFIGNDDVDTANWRPRIEVVENCLSFWCSRSFSYGGKALVVNALALSMIWYVASLVHMPPWVLAELNSVIFKLFWSGKRELVARDVVILDRIKGDFNMVSIAFKVNALLVQRIRRYLCSPNSWVSLMTFWFFDRFGIDPMGVFSVPLSFLSAKLPPFYAAVLDAWKALDGSVSLNGLVVRSLGDSIQLPASSLTCKSCYQLCLLINPCSSHCVTKFRPSFGDLDWPSTWKSLFYMPLDRQVIDLNWKVAHGVLYTAERLSSFGYH